MKTPGLPTVPHIFIKANFTFSIDDRPYAYINQKISLRGISGLRWKLFDPRQAIGRKTVVNLEILAPNRYKFSTPGFFNAERTVNALYLGIGFLIDERTSEVLSKLIQSYGCIPTSHVRKYPRIPATSNISTMPLRVIITSNGEYSGMDIANISPTGLLLRTENPRANTLEPGMRIKGQLEPRGDFYTPINFEALVCRVIEDYNPTSGNIIRHFGIRYLKFDQGHQENYLSLLKDVLLRLREGP